RTERRGDHTRAAFAREVGAPLRIGRPARRSRRRGAVLPRDLAHRDATDAGSAARSEPARPAGERTRRRARLLRALGVRARAHARRGRPPRLAASLLRAPPLPNPAAVHGRRAPRVGGEPVGRPTQPPRSPRTVGATAGGGAPDRSRLPEHELRTAARRLVALRRDGDVAALPAAVRARTATAPRDPDRALGALPPRARPPLDLPALHDRLRDRSGAETRRGAHRGLRGTPSRSRPGAARSARPGAAADAVFRRPLGDGLSGSRVRTHARGGGAVRARCWNAARRRAARAAPAGGALVSPRPLLRANLLQLLSDPLHHSHVVRDAREGLSPA